ncbi:MAG: HD-GYP domain-containing protein [Spirochaetes bacterium]|nr:HD-GYP domain-containing protein [Spirochaetota bacterium]
MNIPLRTDTIIPLIVAPYCLSLGITVLFRLKNIKDKTESIVFFLLCVAAAAWSIGPFINNYYRPYGWLTAVFITNIAILYTLLITDWNLVKIFLPLTFISTFSITFFLIRGDWKDPSFNNIFALLIFPLLIFMNSIVYSFYFKHRTKFHLSIAIMATFMILGGFYDTFKSIKNWPEIPAATVACFGFVIVIGYHLFARGYLQTQGWRDYAKELEQKEKLLKEKFQILHKANIDSVIVLSQTIEAKDPYTRGHCLRVREFAKALGQEFGFDKERLLLLELGALLHDIGKIGIPGAILNKNGKLTKEEFDEIKKHPDIGANILKQVEFFKPIIPMIRHHHEFYNGKGYPAGLDDNKIPLEARIMAVGDAFDAMTSDRPYRKAFSISKALSIVKEVSGSQLDPEIVKIFISKKIYRLKTRVTQKLSFDF